ncbi:MAG: prolipoprotein diacylglyceryl transferase [Bacteroidota bacterium]|nr:prolipoprotein diacylglyceryl transferase [Bacteroidota bacterium]
MPELLFNSFVGFLIGFKLIGAVLNYGLFVNNPAKYVFSLSGNVAGGIVVCAIFFYLTYQSRKSEQLPVPQIVEKKVHPYQLMPSIVFWCAFWGFIGAKIFCCLEDWHSFIYAPLTQLFSLTGWTFYGGLTFGAAAYLIFGYRRGMRLIDLADIGSPGMMLAYAVGRIGCQLSGDGDWGIVNLHPKPSFLSWIPDWSWSFKFPHNVLNAGIQMPNCFGNYCYELPHGVFPTSFYEATICLILFFILWGFRNRIKIAGLMFCIYLIFNGTERFMMEHIKVNQQYHIGQLSFAQAELIGLSLMIGGIVGLIIIAIKKKRRLVTNLTLFFKVK